MGTFLMLSGVAQSTIAEVEQALRDFADHKSGALIRVDAQAEVNQYEELVIAASDQGHITAIYPHSFLGWQEASQHLSAVLSKPVFSLHIHDGDLWMYVLFVDGQEVDHFNPVPDYWDENLPEEEIKSWAGDAATICRYWPNVEEEQLVNYLVRWEPEEDGYDEVTKAYPEDEFGRIDWQMVDFMRRLGLTYPVDERGSIVGEKYLFKIREGE